MIDQQTYKNLEIFEDEVSLYVFVDRARIDLMYKWERPYVERCIEELNHTLNPETVLEIGYGLGFTSKKWKSLGVNPLVVEPNAKIAQMARDDGFEVIEDFIQNITLLEHFDLIYDDRYELCFDQGLDLDRFNFDNFAPWADVGDLDSIHNNIYIEMISFFLNGRKWFQPIVSKEKIRWILGEKV